MHENYVVTLDGILVLLLPKERLCSFFASPGFRVCLEDGAELKFKIVKMISQWLDLPL